MNWLHRLEWEHPRMGRISETVCLSHEGDILAALTALGIGGVVWAEDERGSCDRCWHSEIPTRVWLSERAT